MFEPFDALGDFPGEVVFFCGSIGNKHVREIELARSCCTMLLMVGFRGRR